MAVWIRARCSLTVCRMADNVKMLPQTFAKMNANHVVKCLN